MQQDMEEEPKGFDNPDNLSPDEPKPETSPISDGLEKASPSGSSGKGSQDKISRSKLQYEADPEDLELRQKLLESRMARKKTEEDAKVLMNRLMLLKTEEQKVGSKGPKGGRHGKRLKKLRKRPR